MARISSNTFSQRDRAQFAVERRGQTASSSYTDARLRADARGCNGGVGKVDGLVFAGREINVAQHLAAARALALDMNDVGRALSLPAQDRAQADTESISRSVIFTRGTPGSEPSVLQA